MSQSSVSEAVERPSSSRRKRTLVLKLPLVTIKYEYPKTPLNCCSHPTTQQSNGSSPTNHLEEEKKAKKTTKSCLGFTIDWQKNGPGDIPPVDGRAAK